MVQEEDGSSILTGEVRHYFYDCLIKNCRNKQLHAHHFRQQRGDVLDTHWLEILIFLIGEQAEVCY